MLLQKVFKPIVPNLSFTKVFWTDSNIFEFFSVFFGYISWTVSIRSNKHNRKSRFIISTLRKARVSKKLFHESTRTSNKYHSRFFIQVGHESNYASIGDTHFFNISCHHQTYQKYQQSLQKLGTFFLEVKYFKNQCFQKISIVRLVYKLNRPTPSQIYFTEKNSKIPLIRILRSCDNDNFDKSDNDVMYYEKCLFSIDTLCGFMSNSNTKS